MEVEGWMRSNASCRRFTDRTSQRGQVVVEFFLALLVILAGICGLYQALHFEKDVFNRLTFLREKTFREAHENQDTTLRRSYVESIDFKPLSELTPEIPFGFQNVDLGLRFPDKTYHMQAGSKYADPLYDYAYIHDKWVIFGMLHLNHVELTKNVFFLPFKLGAVPGPCLFQFPELRPDNTLMSCGFVDPP